MIDISIFDVTLIPAMGIALFAGIISFLSPCVLPIVPPYLAYMSGVSVHDMSHEKNSRLKVLITASFFVLGLSTVFIILGFTTSLIGSFFLQNQDWFTTISGIVVMLFGLHFLGIIKIGFLNREIRMDTKTKNGSSFGAYILGLAFAFGWTPCIGPQLGAILTLAASEADVIKGTLLLFVYAVGLGVPFLLVAFFFPHLAGLIQLIKRHLDKVERVMGVLLWTVGLMMLTGQFSEFSYWLLNTFPTLGTFG